jgi:hypothetical protein
MRVKHGENRTPRFALAVFPLDSAKKLQRAPEPARSVSSHMKSVVRALGRY